MLVSFSQNCFFNDLKNALVSAHIILWPYFLHEIFLIFDSYIFDQNHYSDLVLKIHYSHMTTSF